MKEVRVLQLQMRTVAGVEGLDHNDCYAYYWFSNNCSSSNAPSNNYWNYTAKKTNV